MDKKTFERLSLKADIFKALAHPSRLCILERLFDGECSVRELAGLIEAEMPTVSKHLSVLKNAGIISSRKSKNNVFYKIERKCVRKTLDCAEKGINTRKH